MESPPVGPADEAGSQTAVFRRYLLLRIACVLVAALALVAVVLAFVFKNSSVAFVSSLAAFVALFIAFQVYMRKRRAYFLQWINLKNKV
jgi:membrane protein YdbS with pleckstrin-like domain